MRDVSGNPAPHVAVRLRRGATVLPHVTLATHLAALGLPAESDGAGRLALVALGPGTYPNGFLGSVELAPLAVAELEVSLPLE